MLKIYYWEMSNIRNDAIHHSNKRTNDINENKSILLEQIQLQKRLMRKKAKQLGLTHPSVVKCSQELDQLLNEYQEIKGNME